MAFTNQSREVAEPPVHFILWHTSTACKAVSYANIYIYAMLAIHRKRWRASGTLLRIEIRSRVSALVLNMLGCNLQWIPRGCRLDQQELAVSRLGLQSIYCPNSACTSAYRDIKILVLTDYIRGLHCVTHVWYVHSMYYMYIYICVTDYIRAVSENFNALRKRTSTCIYGYLLRRAGHSSMCPTCDQPPA